MLKLEEQLMQLVEGMCWNVPRKELGRYWRTWPNHLEILNPTKLFIETNTLGKHKSKWWKIVVSP